MALMKMRLDLAREPGHPDGSTRSGYIFLAPVNADGLLDAAEWAKTRTKCTVRRFWEGEDEREGSSHACCRCVAVPLSGG